MYETSSALPSYRAALAYEEQQKGIGSSVTAGGAER
jgi:hypothetical protein